MTNTTTAPRLALGTVVLFALTLALPACQGSFGVSSARSTRSETNGTGGGGGGVMLLPNADVGRVDAAIDYGRDAGISVPDAYVPSPDAYHAPSCTPSCSGRACGSDGCGGTCGTCSGTAMCTAAGQCETPPPAGGRTIIFGRVATCSACRAAHAYFDAHGIPYESVDFGDPGAYDRFMMETAAAGEPFTSGSISMPGIVWNPRGSDPVTYGWSEAYARAHGH